MICKGPGCGWEGDITASLSGHCPHCGNRDLRDLLPEPVITFRRQEPTMSEPPAAPPAEIYSQEERRIYAYHDGEKERRVDPMPLWREFCAVGLELQNDLQVARSISKDRFKHDAAYVAKVFKLFQLKPYDEATGKGLTELEADRVLDSFLTFIGTLKKSLRIFPTPSTPTLGSAPVTSAEPDQPIPSTLDSGSTASASSHGRPTLSIRVSESPSEPLSQGLNTGAP